MGGGIKSLAGRIAGDRNDSAIPHDRRPHRYFAIQASLAGSIERRAHRIGQRKHARLCAARRAGG